MKKIFLLTLLPALLYAQSITTTKVTADSINTNNILPVGAIRDSIRAAMSGADSVRASGITDSVRFGMTKYFARIELPYSGLLLPLSAYAYPDPDNLPSIGLGMDGTYSLLYFNVKESGGALYSTGVGGARIWSNSSDASFSIDVATANTVGNPPEFSMNIFSYTTAGGITFTQPVHYTYPWSIESQGLLQVSNAAGVSYPTTNAGLELYATGSGASTTSYIRSYDEDNTAYRDFRLQGSTIRLLPQGGSLILSNFTGYLKASGGTVSAGDSIRASYIADSLRSFKKDSVRASSKADSLVGVNKNNIALGAASSSANGIAKYADSGGKQLASSGVTIDVSNNIATSGTLDLTGILYLRSNTNLLNKAASGWVDFVTRHTDGAETKARISNVDTITASYFYGNGSHITNTDSSRAAYKSDTTTAAYRSVKSDTTRASWITDSLKSFKKDTVRAAYKSDTTIAAYRSIKSDTTRAAHIADTAKAAPKTDTTSLSNRINLKANIASPTFTSGITVNGNVVQNTSGNYSTTGANAGYVFYRRDDAGNAWTLYANGTNASLYYGGDRFTVTTTGSANVPATLTADSIRARAYCGVPDAGGSAWWSTGMWINAATNQLASGTQANTANSIRAFPFVLNKCLTIDSVEYIVTTAAAGAMTVALYRDTALARIGMPYPGTQVWCGGRDTTSATMKAVSLTATPKTLNAGLYWVAYNSNNTATVRSVPVGALPNVLGYTVAAPSNGAYTGWAVARSYDQYLPSTFPASGAQIANVGAPMVVMRVKSVP